MRNRFLLLLALLACPAAAGAFDHVIVDRLCIPSARSFDRTQIIPLGCALIDCCPGCPGGGPLELRISIDSGVLAGAELSFEGLSAADLARLHVDGDARRQANRVSLARGRTGIAGLIYDPERRPPLARLRPIPADRPSVPAAPSPFLHAARDSSDRITVEQYLAGSLVDRFTWIFDTRACAAWLPPPRMRIRDVLRIDGIAAGEDVVVMMDARTTLGCEDGGPGNLPERVFKSTGRTEFLENVLSPSGCKSEIAVFSKNHAMALQPGTWTDALGDEQVVTLSPPVPIDVNIWVMDDAAYDRAQTEISRASDLYTENMVGVNFKQTIRKYSESANPDPAAVINGAISDDSAECFVAQIRALEGTDLYTANTLNVYYVDKTFKGRNCAIQKVPDVCTSSATDWPPANANIIFIGTTGSSTTLAHEIGHAFGLRPAICGGHTTAPDFGAENIMHAAGGDERTSFTLGQVFRMNTHDDGWGGTMLITDGVPGRPRRNCPPDKSDALCPALTVNP